MRISDWSSDVCSSDLVGQNCAAALEFECEVAALVIAQKLHHVPNRDLALCFLQHRRIFRQYLLLALLERLLCLRWINLLCLRVLHRLLSARFQAFQFFLGGLLVFLDAPGNVSLCRAIHLAHVQYSFLAEVLRDDLGGALDRITRNALQFRALFTATHRSEERRVGKEGCSPC